MTQRKGLTPKRVLTFDSGIGGLGVLGALRQSLPRGTLIDYLADNALFPYGEQNDASLVARILSLLETYIAQRRPDVVVIACNTASTLALPALREKFSLPFVGCVPPVRWAAQTTRSGVFGLLTTRATARRPYLSQLQSDFAASCKMIVYGSRALASHAERLFLGQDVDDALIARELQNLFDAPNGQLIDTIGLGCTHYSFLVDAFARLSRRKINWLDPAVPVAQQVERVLRSCDAHEPLDSRNETLLFTAPPLDQKALLAAVAPLGYDRCSLFSELT